MSELLQLTGIEKRYGGVQALRGVDFDLRGGEIHALLGENGAGKSTLMGVISGAVAPDRGVLRLAGEVRRFATPRDADEAGIVMIPQELDLVPGLDIAANLFLGHELLTGRRTLDGARMMREARALLHRAGIDLDPALRVSSLRLGERQLVAIAKALAADARILILDEPTASLSAAEAEHLFMVMRDLRGRGVGIVYISHRLEEVTKVADRVTVMRDGAVAGQASPQAPQAELVRLLVGRAFSELFPPRGEGAGEALLAMRHARFIPAVPRAGWQAPTDVTLSVHEGEIVGLSGLMGAGRTELLSALFGYEVRGQWKGDVRVRGWPARLGSVEEARPGGAGLRHRRPAGHGVDPWALGRVEPRDVDAAAGYALGVGFAAGGGRAGGGGDEPVRCAAAAAFGARGQSVGRQSAEGGVRQGTAE